MDFWELHGILFLAGLAFFPRITVILFSAITGGLFFWVGFLIVPRLFIAIIAAYNFWEYNPVLVIIAFLCAFSGESTEKVKVRRQVVNG